MAKIYVASSWRNPEQPNVVAQLRAAGFDVYDFKNPREGDHGFHWSDIMPSYTKGKENALANVEEYLAALQTDIARRGFHSDYDAMKAADIGVLVLPCGRSAHLELGWMVGQGKRTAILLDPDEDDEITPELMYRMVDFMHTDLDQIVAWCKNPVMF